MTGAEDLTSIEKAVMSRAKAQFGFSAKNFDLKSTKRPAMHAKYTMVNWLRYQLKYKYTEIRDVTGLSIKSIHKYSINHQQRLLKFPEYRLGYGRVARYMTQVLDPDWTMSYEKLMKRIISLEERLEKSEELTDSRLNILETLI